MGTRKFICIVVVLVLGLSLFSTAVGASASCDKEECKHHTMPLGHHAAAPEMGLVAENCCSEPQADPCDLNKDQSSIAQECAVRVSRAGTTFTAGAVPVFNISLETPSLKGLGPKHHFDSNARIIPIYLQNLSIIC